VECGGHPPEQKEAARVVSGIMPMSIEDDEPHPLDDELMDSDVEEKKKDKKKDSKKKSRRLAKQRNDVLCI
jgi:hypothetical protein